MDKRKVAILCRKQREASKSGLSIQYQNTNSCYSFYNGDMMTYRDQIQFNDTAGRKRKATVIFNRIQQNIDAVVGFAAQNRREAKYIARLNETEDQTIYSRNMNALYSFLRDNMNADQVETDMFADMIICGYGAVETDLSYIIGNATTSPGGEIIKVRKEPDKIGWDPSARAKNLLDAGWVYYYDDYKLSDALDLFQGSTADDFQKVDSEEDNEPDYTYNPYGGLYDRIRMSDVVEWSSKDEDLVRVYNHQWFEYETFYRAENPVYSAESPEIALFYSSVLQRIASEIEPEKIDGIVLRDMFDFDPDAETLTFNEKIKAKIVEEFGELIKPVGFKRKCYYTAVVSGTHVFTCFKSVSQQGFSLKFMTGIYNQQFKHWQGMINPMMEPQKYYNKALTELMFTIAANSKGGVMVEEGAVEDLADFSSKWAKTDAVIKVRDGALQAGRIQEKTRGALPTGLDAIINLSDAAISANGVDPAFLGNPGDVDQSGILYKRRIRQVISKMARYFDPITLYQKEDARMMADLIRVWVENNSGEWIRITGAEGADRFERISEDLIAAEYDVSIQEAPQTPEDQYETSTMLGMYADKIMLTNPTAAMKFYAESLSFMPGLDGDVRNRLVKSLNETQEDPRIAQLQAELQALQSEITQVNLQKVQSDTQINLAKIQQIQTDMANKQADTVRILEEAATKGLENDIMREGNYQSASISI
jgi:hypothetical protein